MSCRYKRFPVVESDSEEKTIVPLCWLKLDRRKKQDRECGSGGSSESCAEYKRYQIAKEEMARLGKKAK